MTKKTTAPKRSTVVKTFSLTFELEAKMLKRVKDLDLGGRTGVTQYLQDLIKKDLIKAAEKEQIAVNDTHGGDSAEHREKKIANL